VIQRALLGILVVGAAFFAPVARPFDTWKGYGGGADSSQYSSLKEINKTNVAQLQVAWTFQPGAAASTNPLVVDGVMYVPGGGGITALDAATGKQLWVSQGGTNSRGMNYWESKDRSDRRLVFINQGFIKEINARTGELIATFGENGRVDPSAGADRGIGRPGGNPGVSIRTRSLSPRLRVAPVTMQHPATFRHSTYSPVNASGLSTVFRWLEKQARTRGLVRPLLEEGVFTTGASLR